MSLTFYIIIEPNSQKSFFRIVLYTNMAAVMSRENQAKEIIFQDDGYIQCRPSMASHMFGPYSSAFSGKDFIFLRRL